MGKSAAESGQTAADLKALVSEEVYKDAGDSAEHHQCAKSDGNDLEGKLLLFGLLGHDMFLLFIRYQI